MHSKIGSKLVMVQCQSFGADRVLRLSKVCKTRWHSKLNVLETYISLKTFLEKVLPDEGPSLFADADESCIAEFILILREIRRVARACESDRRVSASRVPRLLYELQDTLKLFSADRMGRRNVHRSVRSPLHSSYSDDKALL